MKTGTLDSLARGEPPSIVLGDGIARVLDVAVGDDVTVKPRKGTVDPMLAAAKPMVFRVNRTGFPGGFPIAPDVRVRSAQRIRNAARLAMRQIEQLSVILESWVLDQFAEREALTSDLIEALSDAARKIVVH